MIISNGGVERVLGPHLQRIYKSNAVERSMVAGDADSVVISTEARLVQLARQTARQLPEVREDRVAVLQQAVSNGEYQPSNDDVAASMLMRGWA